MKPSPGRTTNPLHFEDLEPHRFEDLVRQLAYRFRNWEMLEPLGRSGSDDGIDIRGIEAVMPPRGAEAELEASVGVDEAQRTWFIQCKRERSFGPTKAKAVAAAASKGSEPPHGFILAVATQLSKKTRETLAAELRAGGVREVHAWGKADIEDMLYQPGNDHLLFAYFGISLQVKQRGQTAKLRNRLALKRQIYNALGGPHGGGVPVLIRDPDDSAYPIPDRVDHYDPDSPPWQWTHFREHRHPDQLALVTHRYHAWISADRKRYDVLETCNHAAKSNRDGFEQHRNIDEDLCKRAWQFHRKAIPDDERAWLELTGILLLDNILLIDDLGDAFNEAPHVLVTRTQQHGYFSAVRSVLRYMTGKKEMAVLVDDLKRVRLFPDPIPSLESDSNPTSRDW